MHGSDVSTVRTGYVVLQACGPALKRQRQGHGKKFKVELCLIRLGGCPGVQESGAINKQIVFKARDKGGKENLKCKTTINLMGVAEKEVKHFSTRTYYSHTEQRLKIKA